MKSVAPFKISVPDETLNYIHSRVKAYRWHEMPDDGGWGYGTNLDYLREFCTYWVEEFDWRKHEASLNKFTHFKASVDGIDTHFIYEKSSGESPLPLIISHG